jgi:ATP-binding cassette subfamily B (MDR/TAP) protein 1
MNIRTVLAFPDLIPTKKGKFEEELEKGLPVAIKRAAVSGFAMGVNLFIAQGVIYGVGMYIGLRFVDDPNIDVTFGEVMGAFFAVMMAGMGLGQAGSVAPAFAAANLAANKFFAVKDRVPAMRKPTDLREPVQSDTFLKGRIEAKNVSFSYHSAPDVLVLDNVSFEVPQGSSMAIVGPSGSGKSTIISLIERFYDYSSGSIVMDGEHPINDYDLSYLRSSIGLVSQMPLLFDASVRDNIRGGLMTATKEDIEAAAKSANAHDFIMKLDKGYDTLVGELGGKLSGGQRQRIAIARALLPKPSILLLDEATSALDSKSEKEVQTAIDKITASGQQTTITIAHRLSTIQNSDNILVLVDGKVKESGNHQQLMAEQGVYAALVDAQSLVEQKKEFHRQKSLSHVDGGGDAVIEVEAGDDATGRE